MLKSSTGEQPVKSTGESQAHKHMTFRDLKQKEVDISDLASQYTEHIELFYAGTQYP